MWKLIRGAFEFDLLIKHTIEDNNISNFSFSNIVYPYSYPCLAKVVSIDSSDIKIETVDVDDAKILIKALENQGIL